MIRVKDMYPSVHQTFFILSPKAGKCFDRSEMRGRGDCRFHRREFDKHLIGDLIAQYSKPKDTVLDFFCGTAGVPIMASRLGRLGIGVDKRDVERVIA